MSIKASGFAALSSIMNMTQAEFSGKFPAYDKWAAARAPAQAQAQADEDD